PWFIGELIDGHKGACFAFGVFVDGHYLEGSLTYVVGVIQVRKPTGCFPAAHFLPLNLPLFQMLFFNMPLTAYLCWSVHHRRRATPSAPTSGSGAAAGRRRPSTWSCCCCSSGRRSPATSSWRPTASCPS
ncbi:unnamed protein product, partial [Tetraodon nigroviridis]